jgi:hypothetical protein
VALSFFAMLSLIERFNQLDNASLDRKWMGTSGAVGLLIHELQRERGLSSGFIASRGNHFGDPLMAQQQRTDSSLASLNSIIREQSMAQAIRQSLDAGVKQLTEIRPRVRQLEISRDYTVDRYTGIINSLFDLQLSSFGNAIESSIFRKQMAFIAFAQAKEMAGQERALLSAMLSDNNFSAGRMLTLNNIRAAEEARLGNFVRLAEEDAMAGYHDILNQAYIKEAERIRQKVQAAALRESFHGSALANGNASLTLPRPEVWFELASAKIDAMKALEDTLSSSVNFSAQVVEGRARQELSISALLALLSFVLAGILIRQIQRGGRVAEQQLNLAEAALHCRGEEFRWKNLKLHRDDLRSESAQNSRGAP